MNQPLVTVICNCYNHENFVLKSLNSVANQSYKNIELIVLNNGSTDNSIEKIENFIKEHPKVVFINLEKTLSHTKAFNLASKSAKGSYFIDLSADDVLLENCIETQLKHFNTEDTALVFGNAFNIDELGNIQSSYFKVNEYNKVTDLNLFKTDYNRLLGTGVTMCSASAMFTKKHFNLLNGFNEALFFEDLDYWLRLSYSYKITFIDTFLVEKRNLNSSLGNQFFKKNDFSIKIEKSLQIIFKEAINRNTKLQNKILLKRIHNSMNRSLKNKNYTSFIQFSLLEIQCRLKCF